MPWHLEKEEVPQITGGGTGAASSEAYTIAKPRGPKVSLHLYEAGSDQDVAVVRIDSLRRAASIITSSGTEEVFSVEDLDAALRREGLEPISKETYRKITEALIGA